MTEDELRAIEGRANAATPGPWVVDAKRPHNVRLPKRIEATGRYRIATCNTASTSKDRWEQDDRDAEFIAHAREDVPALLTEVRRLRTVADAARELADMAGPFLTGMGDHGALGWHLVRFGELLDPPAPPDVAPEATQRAQEGR